jgi:tol-pal system protein YbgF
MGRSAHRIAGRGAQRRPSQWKACYSMRLLIALAIAGLMAPALTVPAGAQDRDVRPLLDRLDRIERDMNMLQRQVYRGGTGGAPVPVSPADPGSAVNAELRMDQIEEQMRGITGQIEEASYNIDQLRRRFDKLVGDVDVRLTALEQRAPAGDAVAAAAPAAAATAAAAPVRPVGAGANLAAPPSQSGTLGQVPAGSAQAAAAASARTPSPTAPPAVPPGGLQGGTAQDQYNQAFGLLRQADYPAAEQSLRAFVQRYPNDPLAGNAQYWLGETYYVRGDFSNAAVAFAEGYKRYPQSGKGADSLLKLGMALGNLGQKNEACVTFVQLARDFPNASANVKERAGREKQRLGCP